MKENKHDTTDAKEENADDLLGKERRVSDRKNREGLNRATTSLEREARKQEMMGASDEEMLEYFG